MQSKLVGELNGKWSILFRALMAVIAMMIPFVIAIGTWTTKTLFDLRTEVALIKSKSEFHFGYLQEMKADLNELKKKLTEKL